MLLLADKVIGQPSSELGLGRVADVMSSEVGPPRRRVRARARRIQRLRRMLMRVTERRRGAMEPQAAVVVLHLVRVSRLQRRQHSWPPTAQHSRQSRPSCLVPATEHQKTTSACSDRDPPSPVLHCVRTGPPGRWTPAQAWLHGPPWPARLPQAPPHAHEGRLLRTGTRTCESRPCLSRCSRPDRQRALVGQPHTHLVRLASAAHWRYSVALLLSGKSAARDSDGMDGAKDPVVSRQRRPGGLDGASSSGHGQASITQLTHLSRQLKHAFDTCWRLRALLLPGEMGVGLRFIVGVGDMVMWVDEGDVGEKSWDGIGAGGRGRQAVTSAYRRRLTTWWAVHDGKPWLLHPRLAVE